MTTPIDQLTPEELRVECAESNGYEKQTREQMWWNRELGKYASLDELPNYPADANAALTLAHALAEKGFQTSIHHHPDNTWECIFRKVDGLWPDRLRSATFALALCRAYLSVVRAGKEQS